MKALHWILVIVGIGLLIGQVNNAITEKKPELELTNQYKNDLIRAGKCKVFSEPEYVNNGIVAVWKCRDRGNELLFLYTFSP